MTTITDLLIHPFEIDVDNNNFTVVKVSITEAGKVAGRIVEGGNKKREILGYYGSLAGAMGRVMEEKLKDKMPDLEGRRVSLKEFMAEAVARKELMLKWAKFLSAPFLLVPEDGIPNVSPKQFLRQAGEETVEEEIA